MEKETTLEIQIEAIKLVLDGTLEEAAEKLESLKKDIADCESGKDRDDLTEEYEELRKVYNADKQTALCLTGAIHAQMTKEL